MSCPGRAAAPCRRAIHHGLSLLRRLAQSPTAECWLRLAYSGASGGPSAAKHAEGHAMPTLRTVSSCLMLCLAASSVWAALPPMEQPTGDSKSALGLRAGRNLHTDPADLRERRATTHEVQLPESSNALINPNSAIPPTTTTNMPT